MGNLKIFRSHFEWMERDQNAEADKLCNQALDAEAPVPSIVTKKGPSKSEVVKDIRSWLTETDIGMERFRKYRILANAAIAPISAGLLNDLFNDAKEKYDKEYGKKETEKVDVLLYGG